MWLITGSPWRWFLTIGGWHGWFFPGQLEVILVWSNMRASKNIARHIRVLGCWKDMIQNEQRQHIHQIIQCTNTHTWFHGFPLNKNSLIFFHHTSLRLRVTRDRPGPRVTWGHQGHWIDPNNEQRGNGESPSFIWKLQLYRQTYTGQWKL